MYYYNNLLIINPSIAFDMSFQLSFLSTFALISSKSIINLHLCTLPIISQISLSGFLINPIVIRIFSIILPIAFIGVLFKIKIVFYFINYLIDFIYFLSNFEINGYKIPVLNITFDKILHFIYLIGLGCTFITRNFTYTHFVFLMSLFVNLFKNFFLKDLNIFHKNLQFMFLSYNEVMIGTLTLNQFKLINFCDGDAPKTEPKITFSTSSMAEETGAALDDLTAAEKKLKDAEKALNENKDDKNKDALTKDRDTKKTEVDNAKTKLNNLLTISKEVRNAINNLPAVPEERKIFISMLIEKQLQDGFLDFLNNKDYCVLTLENIKKIFDCMNKKSEPKVKVSIKTDDFQDLDKDYKTLEEFFQKRRSFQ